MNNKSRNKRIVIKHRSTQQVLAEGPLGWGITRFEGNFYIKKQFLKTDKITVNYIPGFCPYKFFYVWMNLQLADESLVKNLAWKYWLPNPLLPFIWFRVALPGSHPELSIEYY